MRNHHKVFGLMVWVVTTCVMMSGCAATIQPENQAYAAMMSLDLTDDGLIEMGILLPISSEDSAGGSGGSGGGGGEGTAGTKYYSLGGTFLEALDLMRTVLQKTLNLSQLKSVVIGQKLASDPMFPDMIEHMMLLNHLYGTALLIVTLDTGKDFIENVKAPPGERLATVLATAYEHYIQQGYLPLTRLSDIYYKLNSIYSDPIVMLAATQDMTKAQMTTPKGMVGAVLPGAMATTGPSPNELIGCALTKNGVMVGTLNGASTRWLMVMRGQLKSFSYMCQGVPLRLNVKSGPKISVDVSKWDHAVIRVKLELSPAPIREMPDEGALRQQIQADIAYLVEHCKSLSIDAFDFAQYASQHFLTIDDFVNYRWNEKFGSAEVIVDAELVGAYAS